MRKSFFLFVSVFVSVLLGQKATAQTISEGLNFMEVEKFSSAGKVFKSLASSKPTGENHFFLGYYYMGVGEPDSARMQFDKGVAADPKGGLSLVGQGSLLLKEGKKAEAKAKFDQAKAITKSKNADVFYRIGEAYVMHEGNMDPVEAVAHADQALKLNKNLADAYVVIGDAALMKLDGTTAANNYDKALALNPKLLKTHVRLGDLFIRSKNLNASRDKYNEAITADANYAPAYRRMAEMYYLAKQYPKAIEYMEKYMALADKSPANQFRYAGFLILVEKHQQALDILNTLKPQYSNSAIYNRLMGYASYETKQCPQGLEYMNKYFTLAKPDIVMGTDYEYLGKLQICSGGDTAKALENLTKAGEMDTTQIGAMREVAQQFFDSKTYVRSAQVMDKYMGKIGTSKATATDFYLLGLANYYANDFVKADTAFGAMIPKLDANKQITAYQWKAKARAKQDIDGSKGLAEAEYQKFLELAAAETDQAKLKRDMVNANTYLALIQVKKYSDLNKGKEFARKALELDPNNSTSKQIVELKDLNQKAQQAAPAPKTGSGTKAPAPKGQPQPKAK
ncbi:MAG: hypothetical protein MUD08_04540 [Cytophagales bacterium]|jgi:tetratricopeptide (TPR) repeat protein|nr:hypothetical protein [Cytophagales bacterium]